MINDWLDNDFINKHNLANWNEAIKKLHISKDSQNNQSNSFRRIAFDEICANLLSLSENRKRIKRNKKAKSFNETISDSILKNLPFKLTNAQYKTCIDEGVCSKPHWDDKQCHIYHQKRMYYGALPAPSRRGDMPVVCITWQQANTFAKWAGARLLSETEWEYIARSGDRSYSYPWGYEEPSCNLAVMSDQSDVGCGYGQMLPVCSKPAGSNSSGVCDLAGNVWEWVMDRYRPSHEKVPTDGKPVLGGGNKVLRGGSFTSNMDELRATTRGELSPNRCSNYVGFRLAKASEVDLR